jgi:hypothetical protein
VLEGLRGEDSIAELCRKEGINQNATLMPSVPCRCRFLSFFSIVCIERSLRRRRVNRPMERGIFVERAMPTMPVTLGHLRH